MWGVFFEDINLGADGGIYAELVKNRSFEFSKPLMGWKAEQQPFREGALLVLNRPEQTNNPRFVRLTLQAGSSITLTNEGFRGMGLKAGLQYHFSCMYRTEAAGLRLQVNLLNPNGETIGSTTAQAAETRGGWQTLKATLTCQATDAKGKMSITIEGPGTIDLDMISLFPADTWKGRPGGMRADMVQLLADMKPAFIRFPGGCIAEGFDLNNRYQWKKTIGPIEERQLIINRWNFEFPHRAAPDYFQTFGLGFFEYFQLAEDLGAEPLPILNCGMACQFNSAELVAVKDLDPYIQDALDLVEFANGDITTPWGKKRADMGHPAPFGLKLLGVGNENWGPQYLERFELFQKAIKAKYPNIKLVGSSGTDPNGERYELLNKGLRALNTDFIDEHYYRKPEWFLQHAARYDTFPRTGSKIFAGEYAAHADKTGPANLRNNWQAALAEAAFLTGLERNADIVHMASYAPLFAHIEGWQWNPDLIWVDNLRSFGTPSYQVQKLFSLHKGHKIVPLLHNGAPLAGQDSLYASAVIDTVANELLIKLVNAGAQPQSVSLAPQGLKKLPKEASLLMLQHPDLMAANTFEAPQTIAPKTSTLILRAKQLKYNAPGYSVNMIRIKM
jgi:alpha-L-arabinofuranosidase